MTYSYRCRLAKLGRARFLSHLDLTRALNRAFRRAGLVLAHSVGYHPHPLLSFGPALAVGIESVAEYFQAELAAETNPAILLARLNEKLPEGLSLGEVTSLDGSNPPSLNAWLDRASYWVDLAEKGEPAEVEALLSPRVLLASRKGPDGRLKEIDLRPLLCGLDLDRLPAGELGILGVTGSVGNLRPQELFGFLPAWRFRRLLRTGLFHAEGDKLLEPLRGTAVNWKASGHPE